MNNLPVYIPIVFLLTTLLTIYIFFKAANNSKAFLFILLTWITIQSIIALTGFYTITNTFPPRFLLLVIPPLLFIIGLFATKKGRQFLDNLDIKLLTLLHIVRIPVEIVLFWLFINNAVPELMTFEGRNFDIISGITAPIIYHFGFIKQNLNKNIILLWNIACIGLLINIVANAILSAPTPFQKFAFDQPNIGILYFPYNLLPGCVVPLVLLSHLATIRKLLKSR